MESKIRTAPIAVQIASFWRETFDETRWCVARFGKVLIDIGIIVRLTTLHRGEVDGNHELRAVRRLETAHIESEMFEWL